MTKTTPEKLIKTPSVDESIAYAEAFLNGTTPMKLWIIGPKGCGKTFLAKWLRIQAPNSKRGAIFDDQLPDFDLPYWLAFSRTLPGQPGTDDIIHMNPPEYERKFGVLSEWAITRGLKWHPQALASLLSLETDNLQLLRSLAERTALEGGITGNIIKELDVVRTLSRSGYLDHLRPQSKSAIANSTTKIH